MKYIGLGFAMFSFVVCCSLGVRAVTVNPTSNVLGDSAPTAGALVVRDSAGLFQIASFTTAQLQATTPSAVGQIVYNSTLPNLCVSTGTATLEAYKLVGTAATTCQ